MTSNPGPDKNELATAAEVLARTYVGRGAGYLFVRSVSASHWSVIFDSLIVIIVAYSPTCESAVSSKAMGGAVLRLQYSAVSIQLGVSKSPRSAMLHCCARGVAHRQNSIHPNRRKLPLSRHQISNLLLLASRRVTQSSPTVVLTSP